MRRRALEHVRRHVVGYLALFLALGGVAHAAFVASNGTIKACVLPTTSNTQANTRIIDEAASCAVNQTAISWNQTGPPGQSGPTGSQGPPGASDSSSASSRPPFQPAEPEGGLGPARKSQRKFLRVKPALKASRGRGKVVLKKPVAPVRVVVSQDSGPMMITSCAEDTRLGCQEAKFAEITCPASAPNVLWANVVGIGGDWDSSWDFQSGSYRPDNATQDVIWARVYGDYTGELNYTPLSYSFRLQGECYG